MREEKVREGTLERVGRVERKGEGEGWPDRGTD